MKLATLLCELLGYAGGKQNTENLRNMSGINSSQRGRLAVEARKLEHHSPHAPSINKVYLALVILRPCSNFLGSLYPATDVAS